MYTPTTEHLSSIRLNVSPHNHKSYHHHAEGLPFGAFLFFVLLKRFEVYEKFIVPIVCISLSPYMCRGAMVYKIRKFN